MNTAKASLITIIALGTMIAIVPVSRAQENNANRRSDRPAAGQQRERRSGPAGADQLERISGELKLSEEQQAKLRPIFQEERTKLREMRQDTALTNEQRREKTREIREQSLAKVKPILTAEQFEQFKKIRREGVGRRPGGGRQSGERAPAPREDKKPE